MRRRDHWGRVPRLAPGRHGDRGDRPEGRRRDPRRRHRRTATVKVYAPGLGGDTIHAIAIAIATAGGGASSSGLYGGNAGNASDLGPVATQIPGEADTYRLSIPTDSTMAGSNTFRVFVNRATPANTTLDASEKTADVSFRVAGAPAVLSMSPDAESASLGSPATYSVVVKDAAGLPVPGQTVSVDVKGAAGQALTASTPAVTDGAGKTTFTVTAAKGSGANDTGLGTGTVRAFLDTNATSGYQAGELNDASSLRVTASGTEAASSIVVSNPTGDVYAGATTTVKVAVLNAEGDRLRDVTPSATVSGSNAGAAVNPAGPDAAGFYTLSYNAGNAGSDTISVFVNKLSGNTPGPDSGEPFEQAFRTVKTVPAGLQVDDVAFTDTRKSAPYVNPLDRNTATVRVKVSRDDVNNDGVRDAGAGIPVNLAVTGTDATAVSLDKSTVTTDASGVATAKVTYRNPSDADTLTVTATIPTPTAPSISSPALTFRKRIVSDLSVGDTARTLAAGSSTRVDAKVLDQFGDPMPGLNVDFRVEGDRIENLATALDKVTNASGVASLTLEDKGQETVPGRNTVGVIVDIDDDDAEPAETGIGEQDASVAVDYVRASDAAPASVALTGTGTAAAPVDVNVVTTGGPQPVTAVDAEVRNASGTFLAGRQVTFTITGAGEFVDAAGTSLGKSTTTSTNSSGVATVRTRSTDAGTSTITAKAGSVTQSGVITYSNTVSDGRILTLTPAKAVAGPGRVTRFDAKVTDRFGNPVKGIAIAWSEDGAGRFIERTATTDERGIAYAELASLESETGENVVTASVAGSLVGTQFDDRAGEVNGTPVESAPAGVATDASSVLIGVAPTLSGPASVRGNEEVVLTGAARPGADVAIFARKWNVADYSLKQTVRADEAGRFTYRTPLATRTYFRAYVPNTTLHSATHRVDVKVVPTLTASSPAKGRLRLSVSTNPIAVGDGVTPATAKFFRVNADGTRTTLATVPLVNGKATKEIAATSTKSYKIVVKVYDPILLDATSSAKSVTVL